MKKKHVILFGFGKVFQQQAEVESGGSQNKKNTLDTEIEIEI